MSGASKAEQQARVFLQLSRHALDSLRERWVETAGQDAEAIFDEMVAVAKGIGRVESAMGLRRSAELLEAIRRIHPGLDFSKS